MATDSTGTELLQTPLSDISEIVERVRAGYRKRSSWTEEQRKIHTIFQLKAFKKLIEENREQILNVLKLDLNKNPVEALSTEYNLTLADTIDAIREYDNWTKPQHVSKTMAYMMDECYVKPEPFGVALIIGAWNYPLQLITLPLVGAIAAGNAAIIKPSEVAINTSNLFAELIPKYMDNEYFAVVTGGVDVAQCLLKERFDHIFYTGSTEVGKIVMRAAAEHLTPVVLELGGKSPAIIADDANLTVAARRIIFGKATNSGQTCIAPDYILCSEKIRDEFVQCCQKTITNFLGEDPSKSQDYGRMINNRHFKRITNLMESTKAKKVIGGQTIEGERYIEPTVYIDVQEDDILMKQEIFGPLLPIVTVASVDDAIKFVNAKECPLAFYVFTEDKSTFDRIANSTSSGSIVHNNTIAFAGLNTFPFGGIGHSGMYAYHGKHTFNAFSHMKPTLRSSTKLDFITKVIYPPHYRSKIRQLNFFQIPSSHRWNIRPLLLVMLLIAAVAILVKIYGVPSFLYSRYF